MVRGRRSLKQGKRKTHGRSASTRAVMQDVSSRLHEPCS